MTKPEGQVISLDLQDLDEIWRTCDAKAAEDRFRKLLHERERHATPDRGVEIEILTQLARAEGAQGRLSEASANLARSEELLLAGQSSYQVSAKIRWLLEKGRLHVLQKTPSQARSHFAEAWTLASHSGEDRFAVDAAMMLATVEPPKAQQDWLARALKLAEESPQPKAKSFLGSLYAAMGWKLFDLRQYDRALELFQKSLSQFKLQGTTRELFVAKWSVGKLLRSMGKLEEALIIQNALLAELGIGGSKDGRLYEELAECLHVLKRSDEAQLYFELAYRELSTDEWIVDNQPAMLKRLKELGKVK